MFNGRRSCRGLYRNADRRSTIVDSAGNIIRKFCPDAFDRQNLCYLTNTVTRITVSETLSRKKHPAPKKPHRSFSRKSKNSVQAGHCRWEEKLRQKQDIQVTALKGGTGGCPCARRLLKSGHAKIVCHDPFAIRLACDPGHPQTQPAEIAVDMGYQIVGDLRKDREARIPLRGTGAPSG